MLAPPSAVALLDLGADARVVRLPRASGHPGILTALLWLIAIMAIMVPATVVRFGPHFHAGYDLLVAIPGRDTPSAPPPVEPVANRAFSLDEARLFNAGVPFSTAANPAAHPFRLAGTPDDLARATDCLAAAVYYEAGDDAPGERAVAQVVLNRVRHPAFPKTVCGVVFQGSERTTGCQFTFACDGALARYAPTSDGWIRARSIAAAALGGAVERTVGYATHYHTDWVVPYWQPSLDKIVAVHTQLFYRWAGWWGTPPAFDRHVDVGEPVIPALARLSDAHRLGALPMVGVAVPEVADDAPPDPVQAATLAGTLGQFLVTLPAGTASASWPAFADRLCAARDRCRVMAWRDKASTATTLPLELTQIASMEFSYVRDRPAGVDRPLWNCHSERRPDPHRCMRRQMLMTMAPVPGSGETKAPALGPAAPAPGPVDLSGVRRKAGPVLPDAAPPPSRTATPTTVSRTARPGDRPAPITPPGTSPAAAP